MNDFILLEMVIAQFLCCFFGICLAILTCFAVRRQSPLAPACNIWLIRSDLTTVRPYEVLRMLGLRTAVRWTIMSQPSLLFSILSFGRYHRYGAKLRHR